MPCGTLITAMRFRGRSSSGRATILLLKGESSSSTASPLASAYSLVAEYFDSLDITSKKHLNAILSAYSRDSQVCGLPNKYSCETTGYRYFDHFPIWTYLEIVPFGTFTYFYKFCIQNLISKEEYSYKYEENIFYFLRTVKAARNRAAHDNLFLNDLIISKNKFTKASKEKPRIQKALPDWIENDLPQKEYKKVDKSLLPLDSIYKNEKICVTITCFYVYKELVVKGTSSKYRDFFQHPYEIMPTDLLEALRQLKRQIEAFIEKVPRNLDYKFLPTRSVLIFLQLLIASWFSI